MSFTKTCYDVRLEVSDGSITLYGSAKRQDGECNDTSINLDKFVIFNDNGSFSLREYGREVDASSQSAFDIYLNREFSGTWLIAVSSRSDPNFDELQKINLDHHIKNDNGYLKWVS
ncbi:CVNH domain-containing protein [Aspergillus glaucus CBS 516.65]|uniref:Cyanovirin-N domain-containing protein n=1 Tax=Aspergillus glaucus CBS 516.65 TaxID=1160497 RepID=A0A1L9V3G3_ASPGL|nr:hypothetical protein ASPGLDRAFT_53635 [Aspergillus glaucus CBS 516.65]OJJ78456.1 hypothetical protein ASPGLDRAFT_53635 [Aspergillus glaucus CBS 516.65]